MTQEEKRKAIIQRFPVVTDSFSNQHISTIVILSYVQALKKDGIIAEGTHELSAMGANLASVCEEFDWKPSDEDIDAFLKEMAEPSSEEMLRFFITEYRNDRNKLMANFDSFRNKFNC